MSQAEGTVLEKAQRWGPRGEVLVEFWVRRSWAGEREGEVRETQSGLEARGGGRGLLPGPGGSVPRTKEGSPPHLLP